MSTKITAENGVEFEVCQLGIDVVNKAEPSSIYARLTPGQRHALAECLSPAAAPTGWQWTRDDLPEMRWLHQTFLDGPSAGVEAGFEDLAVALIDHLNAHHPKPECRCDELRSLIEGQKEHVSKTQRERDAARLERDGAFENYKRMKRERDVALARAAAAESDGDVLLSDLHETRRRVEQAEARTAPAVDRDVVEAAIAEGLHRGLTAEELTRSVCAAIDDYTFAPKSAPSVSRADIEKAVRSAFKVWGYDRVTGQELEVLARIRPLFDRIEAEQDADPVEEMATELEGQARIVMHTVADSLATITGGCIRVDVDALADDVDRDHWRQMARHVLGQEASSDE